MDDDKLDLSDLKPKRCSVTGPNGEALELRSPLAGDAAEYQKTLVRTREGAEEGSYLDSKFDQVSTCLFRDGARVPAAELRQWPQLAFNATLKWVLRNAPELLMFGNEKPPKEQPEPGSGSS